MSAIGWSMRYMLVQTKRAMRSSTDPKSKTLQTDTTVGGVLRVGLVTSLTQSNCCEVCSRLHCTVHIIGSSQHLQSKCLVWHYMVVPLAKRVHDKFHMRCARCESCSTTSLNVLVAWSKKRRSWTRLSCKVEEEHPDDCSFLLIWRARTLTGVCVAAWER